ncbi:hypothetical protein ISS04_04235, partial [Candidatus Woesearchaeota archaeon]|nr:hypothetical protein [Candidatus Woesearchaeota archaeon]
MSLLTGMRGTSGQFTTELKKRGKKLPKMTRSNYVENAGFKIVIAIFLTLLFLGSVTAESPTNSNDQEDVSGFFENALSGLKLITGMVEKGINPVKMDDGTIKKEDNSKEGPSAPSEKESKEEKQIPVAIEKPTPTKKREKTECEKNNGRCRRECKKDEIEVESYSCQLKKAPPKEKSTIDKNEKPTKPKIDKKTISNNNLVGKAYNIDTDLQDNFLTKLWNWVINLFAPPKQELDLVGKAYRDKDAVCCIKVEPKITETNECVNAT